MKNDEKNVQNIDASREITPRRAGPAGLADPLLAVPKVALRGLRRRTASNIPNQLKEDQNSANRIQNEMNLG